MLGSFVLFFVASDFFFKIYFVKKYSQICMYVFALNVSPTARLKQRWGCALKYHLSDCMEKLGIEPPGDKASGLSSVHHGGSLLSDIPFECQTNGIYSLIRPDILSFFKWVQTVCN